VLAKGKTKVTLTLRDAGEFEASTTTAFSDDFGGWDWAGSFDDCVGGASGAWGEAARTGAFLTPCAWDREGFGAASGTGGCEGSFKVVVGGLAVTAGAGDFRVFACSVAVFSILAALPNCLAAVSVDSWFDAFFNVFFAIVFPYAFPIPKLKE
jgi:hypothetical protein